MAIPSIAAVRKALVAPPGKPFDLSKRDTSGREVFADKAEAETSLKKDAAVIYRTTSLDNYLNLNDAILTLVS